MFGSSANSLLEPVEVFYISGGGAALPALRFLSISASTASRSEPRH